MYPDKIPKLSFLGLGCWRFGEQENPAPSKNPGRNYWNGQNRSESLKIIDLAVAKGVTHFDTAQVYGLGLSEQLAGQRLRKIRDKVMIATKIIPVSSDYNSILKKINLSIKRMCTSYIDILYLHFPPLLLKKNSLKATYSIPHVIEALEKARQQGLIHYIGVSNFNINEMEEALKAGNIDFTQIGYNFLYKHREKDVIPFSVSKKIRIIGYSFYAQGLFFKQNIEDNAIINSGRKNLVFLDKKNISVAKEIITQLKNISQKTGYSIPQLLFCWIKTKPWIDGILAGASTKQQFNESIAAQECTYINHTILEKLENLSNMCNNIFEYGSIFLHNLN